jgi:hypothetical protein
MLELRQERRPKPTSGDALDHPVKLGSVATAGVGAGVGVAHSSCSGVIDTTPPSPHLDDP